ncbi:MAG: hypothetical protein Q7W13_07715 [Bacteroidia bacterium]|nr:hypothetical protein [Bacteroidia bacterium]
MNKLTKILIGAGVVVTGGYLFKMSRTSANLETEIKAKIHKLDLSGITVRIDAKIKNPTEGSLKIKYPFVKLSYKGDTVGSSQAINQNITIPEFGEANIEAIMIHIPLIGLLSVAIDLANSIKSGAGVKIGIKIITTIYTTFSSFPYEYEQEQIVKK